LGTSGPIAAAGAASAATYANPATYANQPTQVQQPPYTPIPPPPPYQQGNVYAQPPKQRRGSNVGRNFMLFVIVIVLIGVLAFTAFSYLSGRGQGGQTTNTATPTVALPSNGIGVTKAPNGESIGISDGTFAFDTGRSDGDLKQKASQELQSGNISSAVSLWSSASSQDTSDAEALIYKEDQSVLASGNPYITIVVATMLTGDTGTISVGRDDLQGAYVAQKEFNDGLKLPNGVKVRLLIANSGSVTAYATTVAQEIVQLAQADKNKTFVGVMGWPYSSRVLTAVGILAKARIPMISQTASSDALTGISTYFFRVAPPNKDQGIAGAKYAEQALHASKVALFVDPADSYSQSLADAFSAQFTADGNQVVVTEKYVVGKPDTLSQLLSDAATHNPDLIYFSGFANDASVLLTDLPPSGPLANLYVMGGDALYELGGYQSSAQAARDHLRFTTFAYPDEWQNLCGAGQSFACNPPAFFNNYKAAYDPNSQHTTGSPYGYTRADGDVILSYDAQMVMLTAISNALTGTKKTTITSDELINALKKIQGSQAIQGVSGQISFDAKGNPVKKAFVILKVAGGGFFQEVSVEGCFQVGHCG
jgi:eukaryotic-like serine/threonine-protein kinase